MVKQLRPSHRIVGRALTERLVAKMSLQEVAAILGCSAQGVANIEMVALGKIAEIMRGQVRE
jgi:transcriptional regulator with XRE-family HTH domain